MFIINCKNYDEISGDKIIKLAKISQKISKKYAKLNPTFIAIEPPELIGTGRAISTERPQLITKAVDSVKSAKNSTKLLCGAGIVSGKDVARAKELGSKGIPVSYTHLTLPTICSV